MNKSCAIYARVSTEKQADKDSSIPAQIRICQDYAGRNDLEIANIYTDDSTGTSDRRTGFQDLITDAKKRKFDTILVDQLDRFSRSRKDAYQYKEILRKAGIELIFVSDNLTSGEDREYIREGILELFAEHFSRDLGKKVRRGQIQSVENNYHPMGIAPLGYILISSEKGHKILSPDPEKAPIVKRIFEMSASGCFSTEILAWLNSHCPPARAGVWDMNSVRFLLKNEVYIGTRKYGKIKKKNAHPAIVSEEIFREAERRRKENTGKRQGNETYLLSGVCTCALCGSCICGATKRRYSKKGARIYRYYCCTGYISKKVCLGNSISAEKLEAKVKEIIIRVCSEIKVQRKESGKEDRIGNRSKNKNLKVVEKEIIKLNNQKKNLINALAEGIPMEDIKNKLEEINVKLEFLENQINKKEEEEEEAGVKKKKLEEFINLSETLENSPPDNLKEYYKSFIHLDLNILNKSGILTLKLLPFPVSIEFTLL